MAPERRTPSGNRQSEMGGAIVGAVSMRGLALIAMCVGITAAAFAADPSVEASRKLAAQVAAKVGAGSAIALNVRNLSSMPAGRFSDLQGTIQAELWAQGMQAVEKGRAVAEVEVTVSENARGYLLVADIHQGQNEDVVMTPLARSTPGAPPAGGTMMVLRKTPLLSQAAQILDAAQLPTGGSPQLLVLDTEKITLYAVRDSGAQVIAEQAIHAARNWPRDVRGRLVVRRDHLFDAYLPGTVCSSAGQSVQGTQCRASDDPWPLEAGEVTTTGFYAAARNYFTGTLSGSAAQGRDVGPFYAAAVLPQASYFTGVDGTVRVLAAGRVLSTGIGGWGSDIAALNSGCGSGWQLLATSTADFTTADSVQAYDVSASDAVPVSQRLEFPGPVTALWTSADHASAVAVAHNLNTGQYEAAILTIACSR